MSFQPRQGICQARQRGGLVLLAIFPALTAFVSFYGLFANASAINDHLSMLAGILPDGAVDIIREQVGRIASKGDTKLGFGFFFGLSIALWSANSGMKAIIDAKKSGLVAARAHPIAEICAIEECHRERRIAISSKELRSRGGNARDLRWFGHGSLELFARWHRSG